MRDPRLNRNLHVGKPVNAFPIVHIASSHHTVLIIDFLTKFPTLHQGRASGPIGVASLQRYLPLQAVVYGAETATRQGNVAKGA
jgi:hypothetical protein